MVVKRGDGVSLGSIDPTIVVVLVVTSFVCGIDVMINPVCGIELLNAVTGV